MNGWKERVAGEDAAAGRRRSGARTPAKNADVQKTRTFDTLTDRPIAVTAVYDPDMPWRRRPRRPR